MAPLLLWMSQTISIGKYQPFPLVKVAKEKKVGRNVGRVATAGDLFLTDLVI